MHLRVIVRSGVCVALWCAAVLPQARAGQAEAPMAASPTGQSGAPAASPQITLIRGADGRVTELRAVRLAEPLRIDGRLDEAFYATVPSMSGFVQVEPQEGLLATEQTEVWVAFDRDTLYVSFRCWESRLDLIVAKEMRRDNTSIWSGDDNVAFFLDTFLDRRNGFEFALNSIGGRQDAQTSNERQWNGDWNTIWDFQTGRFDGGWTVETAIPFKSLRYRPGEEQTWGFNAMRTSRWKNELSFLTPTPKARGQAGLHQASLAATLTGLIVPPGSRNLEVKPYVILNISTAGDAAGPLANDFAADLGLDVKYGLTQNLTADFTYNTDFAQVEADTQQVNLTRFSLFFPEKREFFLENRGLFAFGTTQGRGGVPILFYSRRIGLEGGVAVPIDVGGRLTGRVGRYSIGLLNIRTAADENAAVPATHFSVVRLKRDVLRRSSIGLMFTGRSQTAAEEGRNLAYGLDGTFAFFDNLAINTYWAQTDVRGQSTETRSYRAQFDYAGDRYGLALEHLAVGKHFNPGIGFVRRSDIRHSSGSARFSPRPQQSDVVRQYSFAGGIDYVEDGSGQLETRERTGAFEIEFQNADSFSITYTDSYEFLPVLFRIAPGVTLPVGAYDFDSIRVSHSGSTLRRLSGNVSGEYGSFYNGHKTAIGLSGSRVNLSPRFSLEPSYSVNWVDLEQGSFTTQLVGSRVTYTPTALMFLSALLQYNSSGHVVSSNVRFRWEYRPGSEIFVVYNENRDTEARGFPALNNRAFIIKINRLLRF